MPGGSDFELRNLVGARGSSRPDRSNYGQVHRPAFHWWNGYFKAVAAEFAGTLMFQYVGTLAILSTIKLGETGAVLANAALENGLAVAFIVATIGHISGGHINPAVTFGLLVTGNIEPVKALFYITAQLAGAITGAALILLTIYDEGALEAIVIQPGPGVGFSQAIFAEFMGTAILVLVIYSVAVDEKGAKAQAALMIGITVVCNIFAIGAVSGGAMNPARALGPAVVRGMFDNQLIYWIGPLLGGAFGALLYKYLFCTPPEPKIEATEGLFPLPDHGNEEDDAGDEEARTVEEGKDRDEDE